MINYYLWTVFGFGVGFVFRFDCWIVFFEPPFNCSESVDGAFGLLDVVVFVLVYDEFRRDAAFFDADVELFGLRRWTAPVVFACCDEQRRVHIADAGDA